MLTIPNCLISFLGFPNEYYAWGFKTKNLCAFLSVSTASALIIPGDVYKSYAHHNVSCIHAYVCACMCGRILACVCVRSWGGPPRTHAHTGKYTPTHTRTHIRMYTADIMMSVWFVHVTWYYESTGCGNWWKCAQIFGFETSRVIFIWKTEAGNETIRYCEHAAEDCVHLRAVMLMVFKLHVPVRVVIGSRFKKTAICLHFLWVWPYHFFCCLFRCWWSDNRPHLGLQEKNFWGRLLLRR